MGAGRVTREQLTARLSDLQDSIPGVRAARRARSGSIVALAVLALAAVLVLSRRSSRHGAES